METNQEIPQAVTPPKSKKLIAIIVCISIIVGGALWYFFYYTKTPQYSLQLLKTATQNHDIESFKKHVDLDSVLSKGFDDIISVASDKDPEMKSNPFFVGFVNMLKPTITSAFKDEIFRYVETGNWQQEQPKANDVKQQNSNAIASKTDNLKKSAFKGIEYTKKDGKIAVVGVRIFDQQLNRNFIIDVQMRELNDGSWQVSSISNLKDYLLTVDNPNN